MQLVLRDYPQVYLANENAPNQNVVGGSIESLEEVKKAMLSQGAKKVTSLKVSGAFHTPFMRTASEAFRKELENYTIKEPKVPVVSNFKKGDDLREVLARHISHPVKLGEALSCLKATEEDYHLVIGPGKSMASLLKQNKIPGKVLKIDTLEEFRTCLDVLKEKTHG